MTAMNKISQLIEQQAENPAPIVKLLNYLAALLGIGTFLQVVNLVVGICSAGWLLVQAYGYIRYELPLKRLRLKQQQREMGEPTDQAPLT